MALKRPHSGYLEVNRRIPPSRLHIPVEMAVPGLF